MNLENIIQIEYFQNLIVEQLQDQLSTQTVIKPRDDGSITRVLRLSTAPLASVLRKGPPGLNPECICGSKCEHFSFFEAMKNNVPLTDYCPDRNTFLVGRLPVWLTGLKNKTDFKDLPNVYHVFNVLRRGTFWWRTLCGQTDNQFKMSLECKLILFSCTGQKVTGFPFVGVKELLGFPCSRPGLSRLRNWLITLDGLLISILLGSQGHPELCNWEFFDGIMQSYLKTAIGDLFKRGNVATYYSLLKESRNIMKDRILKERTLLLENPNKSYFRPEFWYFDKVVRTLNLNVPRLNPKGLETIGYLTQTRCCGLPPEPVEVKALIKFRNVVGSVPKPLSRYDRFELSRAMDQLILYWRSRGNYENFQDTASRQVKISLSNSASFNCTREQGGKIESARRLIDEMPDNCPYFDLETGQVLRTFGREDDWLTPGEKLLHLSIAKAILSLTDRDPMKQHIGDVRISVVQEPGKARVITVSTIEHSIILHPLGHFLAFFIALVPSSKTGLLASNHMWDTFKRMEKDNIPVDGIYSAYKAASTFMGSEDWEDATNAENPHPFMVIFDSLAKLGIPKFYLMICKIIFTMPRRVYDKSILTTGNFSAPLFIKYTGILQGDPCCKNMLHLTHIVTRLVAQNQLKRIGLKSINLPILEDKTGNKFGSIPNLTVLKDRLSREDLRNEVRLFLRNRRVPTVPIEEMKRGVFASLNLMRKE